MSLYRELSQIASVPEDLLNFTPSADFLVEDIGYGVDHYKNNKLISPCIYKYGKINQGPLVDWILKEIRDFKISLIQWQSQIPANNLPSTHVVHSDIDRKYALNYIIKTGGEDVITSWYHEKNKPIFRTKTSGGQQSDNGIVNYENLTLLDSTVFKPFTWYLLNVSILHDVDNIVSNRESITLSIK
jgi:hypothetical protein